MGLNMGRDMGRDMGCDMGCRSVMKPPEGFDLTLTQWGQTANVVSVEDRVVRATIKQAGNSIPLSFFLGLDWSDLMPGPAVGVETFQ